MSHPSSNSSFQSHEVRLDALYYYLLLAKKARFARVSAAHGWNLPYSATLRNPMDQTNTLDQP